jgi:hypothetical protein
MKKAFLDSKWYFYIPLISIFFLKEMVNWIFDGKDSEECNYRNCIISYTTFIHAIPILGIINFIQKLM